MRVRHVRTVDLEVRKAVTRGSGSSWRSSQRWETLYDVNAACCDLHRIIPCLEHPVRVGL